jgi:hypothetical protein
MNRGQRQAVEKGQVGQDEVRRLTRRWLSMLLVPASVSRSIPTSTARSVRSSSPSIRSSAKVVRVLGFPSRSRSIGPLDLKTGPRAKRGQVLALALYHRHWLWISFPRG